jgi:hypothetical protein
MGSSIPPTISDRVAELRRAVSLTRHYRDEESLSIGEIAQRLGRAPSTIKAYLYDPTGEKARAVKCRYRGTCLGCGAPTSPRNGKWRRIRLLQSLPAGRDRAPLDARAGERRDARLGRPPRLPALVV